MTRATAYKRHPLSKLPDVRLDMSSQIDWLETEIAAARTRAMELAARYNGLRDELDGFFKEYTHALAGPLKRLSDLDAGLKVVEDDVFVADEKQRGDAKKLYRKLVKSVHPDAQHDDPDAIDAFRLVQHLYENADITTLELIDEALNGELSEVTGKSEVERLAELQAMLDAITNRTDGYLRALHETRHSPLYELYLKSQEAEMRGESFMHALVETCEEEIAKRERAVARAAKDTAKVVPLVQVAVKNKLVSL